MLSLGVELLLSQLFKDVGSVVLLGEDFAIICFGQVLTAGRQVFSCLKLC